MKKVLFVLSLAFALSLTACNSGVEAVEGQIDSTIVVVDSIPCIDTCAVKTCVDSTLVLKK